MRDHRFEATLRQPKLCHRCGSVEAEHDPFADLSFKAATRQDVLPPKSKKLIPVPFIDGPRGRPVEGITSFKYEDHKFVFRSEASNKDTYWQSEKDPSNWFVVVADEGMYRASTDE